MLILIVHIAQLKLGAGAMCIVCGINAETSHDKILVNFIADIESVFLALTFQRNQFHFIIKANSNKHFLS